MRRQPTTRPENQLRLALDEIERLKADVRRFGDGSGLVITTPTPGSGPDDGPPTTPGAGVEPLPHVLYGSKHTRSLRVTAGAGLNIDWEQGQIWMAGVFYSIAAATIGGADDDTNYVFVAADGTVAVNTTGFPSNCAPLAVVVTSSGAIVSVADRRSYLAGGVHGVGILLGNPLAVGTDDTDQGTLILYGDGGGSTEGGEVRFHLAADHDGVFEHWLAEAYEDDFRILRSDGGVVPFTIKADRSIEIGTSISLDSGGLIVGVDGEAGILMSGTNWSPATEMGIGEWFSTLLLQGLNGMYFVIDPGDAAARNFYWYHGGDANTGTLIMQLNEAGRLLLPIQGVAAGLLLGGDVLLYRAGANVLQTPDSFRVQGTMEMDGALNHDGATVGFYGTVPVAQQAGVAVTAAAIHAALVNLGLITA